MRKYEVDRIHNSKDDEIYQIAQSVEQKVRTGMLMPDYEMSQKPFHHWGDVILNYLEPSVFVGGGSNATRFKYNYLNNWFESTYEVKEIEFDGKMYVTEISVDSQCMKCYCNAKYKQITSGFYTISFSHDYGENILLEYYDEADYEWIELDYNTMGEAHNGHYTGNFFKFDGEYEYNTCSIKIRFDSVRKIRIRSNVGYLNKKDNNIHGYVKYGNSGASNRFGKGIVLSRNKQWIYIESDNLHDVCVKHGGMKYIGDNDKTIYKIINKNSKKFGEEGLLYYGYSNPRLGDGNEYERGGRSGRRRIGWIKCNWLGNDFTLLADGRKIDDIYRILCRRHKQKYPPNSGKIEAHFIRVNIVENCYELWNLTVISERPRNYQGTVPFIKPIFLKILPKDDVFKILEKKFVSKIEA